MMTAHLDEEQLHQLADNAEDAKLRPQREHILDCTACREQLQQLQQIQAQVNAHAPMLSRASPSSETKAKLHALTHEYAMAHAQPASTASHAGPSWLQRIMTWRPPAISLPAVAMASFALAFVLFTPSQKETQPQLLSFQEGHTLELTAKMAQPGLGFFHGDGKSSKLIGNYAGFKVNQSNDGDYVEIHWPAIDGATGYQLELIEVSDNVRQQVEQTTTESTLWRVPRDTVRSGVLYRLILSGSTDDNYLFRHSGGFVMR